VAKIASLTEAVAELVHDGDTVALEGFTHLIPFAAGHEIIRQRRRDLTLARLTPDLVYDQMIGAGCARKLVFSWGGNPGVGSLYRLRDAVTAGWPAPLEIEEHTHAGMANRYVAGASGLPFAVLRGSAGTDLPQHTPTVSTVRCPFTGEVLTAVAALNPDVAIVHAQRADGEGNVQYWGISGVQKEAVLAARRALVTVEEVVDELTPVPGAVVLPRWVVSAVAVVPRGAAPSYAHGYYERDNAAYLEWEKTGRDRETFTAWLRELEQAGPPAVPDTEHQPPAQRDAPADPAVRPPAQRAGEVPTERSEGVR
jgi:glutaconate CoA-transferase subunit A